MASLKYQNILGEAQNELTVLSRLPEVSGTDAQACDSILADINASSSQYTALGVINLDGDLWCDSLPFTSPLYLGDRDYFQEAVATNSFSVGNYTVGRISGKPVVDFAMPGLDANGNVARVVFLGMDLSWLGDFAKSIPLPPGSTAVIMDDNGTTLAQYPDGNGAVGKTAPQVNYKFDELAYMEQGLGEVETTDASGTSYYLVVVPLNNGNQAGYLHLIISIPTNSVD
jgi:hypothetical protein